MFHLDSSIFGHPDYGLSQTQEGQFHRGAIGDVGRSLFKSRNPSGPLPVKLIWHMSGATYTQFRTDWQDPLKLSYGASWFTMDLPLMVNDEFPVSDSGSLLRAIPFEMTVGVGGSGSWGARAVEGFGAITPDPLRVQGRWAGEVYCDTLDQARVVFTNTSGIASPLLDPVTGATLQTLQVDIAQAGISSILTWNAAALRYDLDASGWKAFLSTKDGQDISARLTDVPMTKLQRYRCHFNGSYSTSLAGYDYWAISATLDVDASPELNPQWTTIFPPQLERDPATGEITLSGLVGDFIYELNNDGTYVQHVAADAPVGTYTIVGTTLGDSVEAWHDGPGVSA